MAHEVVWYDSSETGAPPLSSTAGTLTAVLDACLVDGFNARTVASISIAAGVATVVASAHGYSVGKIVEIAGASVAALNARHRIASVIDSNTFTIATSESGPVAGSMTVRRPPLGWARAHTGVGKRVYARTALGTTNMVLQVDDSAAGQMSARAVGAESATDVDTLTSPFPTPAQLSGGVHVSKGVTSGGPKRWTLIGDGAFLHLFTEGQSGYGGGVGGLTHFAFGDVVALRASDAYRCVISGAENAYGSAGMIGAAVASLGSAATFAAMVFARAADAVSKSPQACTVGPVSGVIGGASGYQPFPNHVNGGFVVQRDVPIAERQSPSISASVIRGFIPGLVIPLHQVPANAADAVVADLAGLDRRCLVVPTYAGQYGGVLIDIDGPWGI